MCEKRKVRPGEVAVGEEGGWAGWEDLSLTPRLGLMSPRAL